MADPTKGNSTHDTRVEQAIGHLLRFGVVLAALVSLMGGIPFLWVDGADPIGADYRTFRGEPSDLRFVGEIVASARALDARAIIQLGLVLLIFTPVARVAFTLFAFLAERDWLYVAATLLVLSVLACGLFGMRL
jgi:uncharacterized membrane protein